MKQQMSAILQVAYGENCAVLGAGLFAWQQTIAWDTVGWHLFWSSVLEKSIDFSFHTLTKRWWIDIRHFLSAKIHSHKIKSRFSRWTKFPQHKLCLGEVRPHYLEEIHPFCLPVAFNTPLTITWRNRTWWHLKGIGGGGGGGKKWN